MSLFFNEILAFEDVYTFFIYKIYTYVYIWMCLFSASCRGSPLWTVGRGYVCSLENTFVLGQKASFRGFWLSVFTECNKSKIRTIMSCVFKGATNDPFAPVACSILGKYIEVIEGIGKIEVFFTSLGFHGMSFLCKKSIRMQKYNGVEDRQKNKRRFVHLFFFGEGCITDTWNRLVVITLSSHLDKVISDQIEFNRIWLFHCYIVVADIPFGFSITSDIILKGNDR